MTDTLTGELREAGDTFIGLILREGRVADRWGIVCSRCCGLARGSACGY